MRNAIGMVCRLCLVVLIVVSVTLVGCGGKQARPKSGARATQAAKGAPEEQPQAKATKAAPTTSGGEEKTELESTLDNFVKLAPLHITSTFVYKKGEKVEWTSRFEADLDAKGNEHILIYDQNNQKTELYIVDLKLDLKDESGAVMALGDMPKGGAFTFLAVYGGAYLLAFNNLEEARRVGSETVNGFSTDKYEIKINLMNAGIPGAAVKVQGAEWDYKGLGWIEKQAKALVRAQVDWKGKPSGQDILESYHSEFEAQKGTVTEIKAPPSATPTLKPTPRPEITNTSEPEPTLEPMPTEEPEPTEESEPTEEPSE